MPKKNATIKVPLDLYDRAEVLIPYLQSQMPGVVLTTAGVLRHCIALELPLIEARVPPPKPA